MALSASSTTEGDTRSHRDGGTSSRWPLTGLLRYDRNGDEHYDADQRVYQRRSAV
jgi:hypothetical protein